MNRTMLKFSKMELENKITVLFVMVGMWILTVGIVGIISTIGNSHGADVAGYEMVAVGTMFLIGIIMAGRYISFQDFAKQYVLAVHMGRRKRDILAAHLLGEVVFIILSFVLTFLLYKAELFLYDKFGFVKYEFSLDSFFTMKPLVCLTIILSVMSMFAGALFLWKAWVPWIFWCGGCILLGRVTSFIHQIKNQSGVIHDIVNWFCELPIVGEAGIVLVAAVALGIAGKKILYSRNL